MLNLDDELTYPELLELADTFTNEIEKRRCERDFSEFVKFAWPIIEPATPLAYNWHIDVIAGYLQAFHRGELPNKRLIINVPPGTLKSVLVSVLYPAWIWISEPGERILTLSAEQGLAIRDAIKMKQVITSDWYQSKWPLKLDPAQNEKSLFINERRGFRQAQGISGAITGRRGSLLILDDVNDAKQAFSDVIRESVNTTFDQSLTTRVNDPVHSGIILIQQRLHCSDLTGHLLKKSATHWTHLKIPMRFEGEPTYDSVRDIGREDLQDPRVKKGQLLFPNRFTDKAVRSLEEDLGEYGSCGQLQQRPSPISGGILKKHWFRVLPDDEKKPVCEHIFISLDTAFSEADSKTSAFSACTRYGIFWHEQRQRYCILILGMWFDRVGYDQLRRSVQEMDKKYNPDIVLIEKKATGISLIQDMKRAIPGRVKAYSPGKGEDKISRAHSVSPMLESGLVYIPNKPWALGNGKDKLGLIDYVSQFPTGAPPSADLCLVAGTLIATKRGNIPIETVTTKDYVLTPIGWKKVKSSGFSGIKNVISKCGLIGTESHPVYTFDKGFINLDVIAQESNLMRNNVCCFIKIARLGWLNLMVENTEEYRQAVNIISLIDSIVKISQKGCMLIFGGSIISKMFKKDMRSTISTGMYLIIALRTLSAYRVVCIERCLRKILIRIKSIFICRILDSLHPYGTDQMLVENGIVKMQNELSARQNQERCPRLLGQSSKVLKSVFGVATSLSIKAREESSALRIARVKKVDTEEENINSFTPIMRPVFNLSVDPPNCYFANGILVHNCDTLTQALIYLRAGGWAGNHPDDEDDYEITTPVYDEDGDNENTPTRSPYGG